MQHLSLFTVPVLLVRYNIIVGTVYTCFKLVGSSHLLLYIDFIVVSYYFLCLYRLLLFITLIVIIYPCPNSGQR
jgi:hypothetical protein